MFKKIYIVKSTGVRISKGKIGIAIFYGINKNSPIYKIYMTGLSPTNNLYGLLNKNGFWIRETDQETPKWLGAWSFDIIG